MTADTLGAAVRQARQAKGYSLRGLQQLCGVGYSYIAYLEQGRIARPDRHKLDRIARALDLQPADLYALAGYHEPDTLPDLVAYLELKYGLSQPLAEHVADYVAALPHDSGEAS